MVIMKRDEGGSGRTQSEEHMLGSKAVHTMQRVWGENLGRGLPTRGLGGLTSQKLSAGMTRAR